MMLATLCAQSIAHADHLAGSLVYYTETGGQQPHHRLNVMDPNGGPSVEVPLPTGGLPAYTPRWSHDGQWITYVGQDLDESRIFLVHPDGSGLHKVDEISWPSSPSFSPDDRKIAYNKVYGHLYVVDLAEPDHPIDLGVHASYPEWSPDGNRIAYSNWANGGGYNSDIFVYDFRTGLPPTQITHHTGDEAYNYPSWSPDGTMLTFQKLGLDGDYDVWRMNDDGSNQINLTPWSSTDDACVSWALDGQHIVFNKKDAGGLNDIWIMDLNGGNPDIAEYGLAV